MARSSWTSEYGRLAILFLFLSLGFAMGLLWASSSSSSCTLTTAGAQLPSPRKPELVSGSRRLSGQQQPAPSPPREDVIQAIEALQLIQQRHQGPDDDDAVANIVAKELLRRGNVNTETHVDVQVHQPGGVIREKQPVQHHIEVASNSNNNQNADDAKGKDAPHVNSLMADLIKKLDLGSKVDLDLIGAPPEQQPQQNKVEPVLNEKQQDSIPAYMMNTMPDEPPYGAPPDPTPNEHPKLFALVLTTPTRHDPKAIAVNKTWGADFDGLAFMTSEHFPTLNTVIIPIKDEDRKDLWLKTRLSLIHAYAYHLNDYDWFMKADDDTYVMVDNLRKFLSKFDPNKPHFFGRRFLLHRGKKDWEMSYHSGGAGYVLSRRALQLLGERAEHVFRKSGVAEDVEIARSLQALGIQCEDTRDETGRETFLPLNIQRLRYEISKEQKPDFWYWRYAYYPARDGLECCSRNWISTHYVYSKDMYTLQRLHRERKEAAGEDPLHQLWPE
eukprot:m.208477 g.208477  ORF g.208477 m.208477 type:complete len:499 (+) comp16926_c1_seq1:282-1778(+)